MTEQMLRQYTVLVEYLGKTLGPDYEVVLHEILPETSRVAAIANGTISGRDVGAPITNAALRMIMQKQYETSDYNLNYTGQLANGKTIRSSTMFIKDGGKLVGLLCINFDDSRFHEISDAILKLIHPDDFVHHHYFPVDAPAKQPMQPQHAAAVPAEHFQSDMNSLMEELFETVTKSVNVPLDRLTQAERTRIIAQLHEQGMFELRGAVQFTVKKRRFPRIRKCSFRINRPDPSIRCDIGRNGIYYRKNISTRRRSIERNGYSRRIARSYKKFGELPDNYRITIK